MIKLKSLLEIVDQDLSRLLDKIKNKQFRFLGSGDNGRVYEIDGEDRCFKITKEQDEFAVAEVIVGRWTEFTTFIPVYYVNSDKQLYIMANADAISVQDKNMIDSFLNEYAEFARSEGGEVSVFEFLDQTNKNNIDPKLLNFLQALKQDINKIRIPDLELDLDFKSDNIMLWNGNLVMVDW